MTGHRQSAMEREREFLHLVGFLVSRIPPFFREMPDRFTRVITRFLRYSSLFCKLSPNRFSPLIFIILTLVPISQPPNVFSRSLPEFSASPLSNKRSIRYFSGSALDIPRKQPRSIGIAENERQVSVSVASVSREWSRSSCATVDRVAWCFERDIFSTGWNWDAELNYFFDIFRLLLVRGRYVSKVSLKENCRRYKWLF